MRPSRLATLIHHLPMGAAVWRQINPLLAWSPEMHLQALIADELAIANWQRAGGKGRKPKPIPRPGPMKDIERVRLDRFSTTSAFDQWREQQLNT